MFANFAGTAITPEYFKSLADVAHKRGIPVHLDGARIFNAATALGVSVKDLTKECDSVQFCLSKGLGAPIGSILVGTEEFIKVCSSISTNLPAANGPEYSGRSHTSQNGWRWDASS